MMLTSPTKRVLNHNHHMVTWPTIGNVSLLNLQEAETRAQPCTCITVYVLLFLPLAGRVRGGDVICVPRPALAWRVRDRR
jgi:hypothetical protein